MTGNVKLASKATPTNAAQITLTFDNNRHASALFGQFEENLAQIEKKLGVDIRSKGNQLTISGEPSSTEKARRALDALYAMVVGGHAIAGSDVDGAIRMAVASFDQPSLPTMETKSRMSLSQITTRKRTIHARTPTQNVYMRALDKAELVMGVGPAGTGKTYLAVAHAAMLLERGAVERIILSRPAVEAGERLGFLPGDMKEKVDPYLRPLYDALYDMMPGDKVERAIAAGVIEIAPLGLHARPHLGAQRGDPRRGAEHHRHADENVPDASGRKFAHDRHRRSEPDRSSAGPEVRPCRSLGHSDRCARHRNRPLHPERRGAPSLGGRNRQRL